MTRPSKQQQQTDKVDSIVAAMRDGAILRCIHQPNSILWLLSTGRPINNDVARLVVEHSDIVGVGDCLFGPEISQTWRYIEN